MCATLVPWPLVLRPWVVTRQSTLRVFKGPGMTTLVDPCMPLPTDDTARVEERAQESRKPTSGSKLTRPKMDAGSLKQQAARPTAHSRFLAHSSLWPAVIYRRLVDDVYRPLDSATTDETSSQTHCPKIRRLLGLLHQPLLRRSVSLGSDYELLDLPAEMNRLPFTPWI